MKNKPMLTILVGISASGKSMYARNTSEYTDEVIISSDNIREELSFIDDQSKNAEVFQIFNSRIKENLLKGNSVIADATSITIKARRSIIENVKNIDCTIVGYVFTKPLWACKRDNANRERTIPEHVLYKQIEKYQIPFLEEGFDEIIIDTYFDIEYKCQFVEECENRMKGFNQNNPYHNEELYEHCMTVHDSLEETTSNYNILLASRLHDFGKLLTETKDENGVSHYYSHANVGAYYFLSNRRNMLNGTQGNFLDMLFYINYHMLPMDWNTTKSIKKWKKIFGEEKFNNLTLFNKCDKIRK